MKALKKGMKMLEGVMNVTQEGHAMVDGKHMDDSTAVIFEKQQSAMNMRRNLLQQMMSHIVNQQSMLMNHNGIK